MRKRYFVGIIEIRINLEKSLSNKYNKYMMKLDVKVIDVKLDYRSIRQKFSVLGDVQSNLEQIVQLKTGK